jgi:hypothetical protein
MKPFAKLKPMRILVGAPTNEIKNYCLDKYLGTITNLLYPKNLYDIMLVDNSESTNNTKKIMQMGVNCVHIKPKGKSNQKYIAESQELLRLAALKGNYDYLLMIESDVIPPLYVIHSLLSHQKQVVGGYYMTGHGSDSFPMKQLVEQDGNLIRHTLNSDSKHGILSANGKLQEVHNMGFGCVAIHKSVLQNIKFRVEDGSDSHSDSFFAADLNFLGIKQYQDTSLVCDHINSSWSEVVDFKKS